MNKEEFGGKNNSSSSKVTSYMWIIKKEKLRPVFYRFYRYFSLAFA